MRHWRKARHVFKAVEWRFRIRREGGARKQITSANARHLPLSSRLHLIISSITFCSATVASTAIAHSSRTCDSVDMMEANRCACVCPAILGTIAYLFSFAVRSDRSLWPEARRKVRLIKTNKNNLKVCVISLDELVCDWLLILKIDSTTLCRLTINYGRLCSHQINYVARESD